MKRGESHSPWRPDSAAASHWRLVFVTKRMQGQNHKNSTSGLVRIQKTTIYWDYGNKNILQIETGDIAIIGEYTNSDGPYLDDWFLVLVTKDGQWKSIPWYADNIDELTKHLSDKFQEKLGESNLINSSSWKSLVSYPKHLKGQPLFKLTPTETYKEPKSFFDKMLHGIGLGNFDTNKYIQLTDEVLAELSKASR